MNVSIPILGLVLALSALVIYVWRARHLEQKRSTQLAFEARARHRHVKLPSGSMKAVLDAPSSTVHPFKAGRDKPFVVYVYGNLNHRRTRLFSPKNY